MSDYDAAYSAVEEAKRLARDEMNAAITAATVAAHDTYREACGDADVEFAAAINDAIRAAMRNTEAA